MKTIIILSLLCICFNSYAQYPVTLNPEHPKAKELAKLECSACAIRILPTQSIYLFWPYVEPKMNVYDRILYPGPPKVEISFNTVKGKTYLLRMFFDPHSAKVFDITDVTYYQHPIKTVYYPKNSVNDSYITAFTAVGGKVTYRINAMNTDFWIFNYCTITELDLQADL